MYAEIIQNKVANELLQIITDVVNSSDYFSQDGFLVYIEICYRNPTTVKQIQQNVAKATAKEGKQFKAIAGLPEDLDSYLPPSKGIVTILKQKYYQQHGWHQKRTAV